MSNLSHKELGDKETLTPNEENRPLVEKMPDKQPSQDSQGAQKKRPRKETEGSPDTHVELQDVPHIKQQSLLGNNHPGSCDRLLSTQSPKKMGTREAIDIMMGKKDVDHATKFEAVKRLVNYDKWKELREPQSDTGSGNSNVSDTSPGDTTETEEKNRKPLLDLASYSDHQPKSVAEYNGENEDEASQTGELILGDQYSWTLSATIRTDNGIKLGNFVRILRKYLDASCFTRDMTLEMQIEARSGDKVIRNISMDDLQEYASRRRMYEILAKQPLSYFRK